MTKKRGVRRSRAHAKHGSRLARKAKTMHVPHRGIRILLGYMSVLAITYLLYVLAEIFHPDLSAAPWLIVLDAVMVVSLLLVIHWMWERHDFAWRGGITWFALAIVYSVVAITYFHQEIFELAKGLVSIALVLGIILNSIIIWYIHEKKDYFTRPGYHEHFEHEDAVFSHLMITFWVIVLAIGITAGLYIYGEVQKQVDESLQDLRLMSSDNINERVIYCKKKVDGADVCLLVLSAVENDKTICSSMHSKIYQFACHRL